MIFKTITNESTGAIKSVGLFGKTIDELKISLSSIKTNGLFNSIFNVSSIDNNAITKYNAEIEKATANSATMAEKQQIMQSAMKGTNRVTAQLIGTTNGATVSTEALTAAQHSSTIAARAQATALKAVSIASNMILFTAITKVIELAVKGIDELVHSSEHCKKRVDELMSSYNSTISTLNDSAKTISEIADRYNELSKSVGALGNNISLTGAEFEEYHSITSKIAEMYPNLVNGWDAQGNAIVNLTDSVKELNAEYEKSLHDANLMLMESKEDIFKNYENTINDINRSIGYSEKALEIIHSGGDFYDVIYDNEGYKTSYYKAFEELGLSIDDMVAGNFDTLEKQIVLKINSLKDEAENAAQGVTPLLKAYLLEDVDFQALADDELKNILSIFINNLPSSLVTAINNNGVAAGSNFVEEFVDAIKEHADSNKYSYGYISFLIA